MDIFDFAMQMEEDGKNFYLELVEKATDKGMKSIFKMLANDELKHYYIIKDMKEKQPVMAETEVLENAKNIFAEMKEKNEEMDFPASAIDLYKKAQEIEERSRSFYLDRSEEIEGPGQKELFLKLAEEEKKHYFLLENIIEFVSRPQTWLENAEFNRLEIY